MVPINGEQATAWRMIFSLVLQLCAKLAIFGLGTIEKVMAKSDEELGLEVLIQMLGGEQKPGSGK